MMSRISNFNRITCIIFVVNTYDSYLRIPSLPQGQREIHQYFLPEVLSVFFGHLRPFVIALDVA